MIYTRTVRVGLPWMFRGADNIRVFTTSEILEGKPVFSQEGVTSSAVVELRDDRPLHFEIRLVNGSHQRRVDSGVITATEGKVMLNYTEPILPVVGRIRPAYRPSLIQAEVRVGWPHKEGAAAYFFRK